MTWTEIAVDMARLIAAQRGCELESFSLDGVEIDGDVIRIQAHAEIAPLPDDIPFDDESPAEPVAEST